MAVKKKAELGPKAKLMKKNVDQLKRQAKKLKVQNYSTKKKEQLVNSIMMAEARAKRKPGTKRKKAAPKASAVKSVSTRVTMKGSGMKRMVKKRGAMPNRVMKNPARNATRRPNKPMMAEYNGWPNYETWLMNLWYGDYFYSYVSEGIEDGWIDLETSRDPYELGNMLKDHVEELIEMEGQVPSSGFVADLFNGAMRDINWYSIGDSLISDL
jgi:hypothetical protein